MDSATHLVKLLVGFQEFSGGLEVSLEPGGIQSDGLQGLLDGPLRAGGVVGLEELFNFQGGFFRSKVLGGTFDEA